MGRRMTTVNKQQNRNKGKCQDLMKKNMANKQREEGI